MTLRRRTLLAIAGASLARAGEVRRLTVPLAAPPAGVIPGLNEQPECRLIGTKIYQGLVRFSPTLTPLPELAVAWTLAPDRLSYSFTLRPGITWHDGAPFTADDVVFSIDRFHRAVSPRLEPVLRRVAGVQGDGRTVVVRLTAPDEGVLFALDAASLPIVPRHLHDHSGFGLDPRQAPPVGTGPFEVAFWLRLRRFAGFAGSPPDLDEILFTVSPDPATRLAATQTGQPTLLAANALTPGMIPRLRQQGMTILGEVTPNHAGLAWLDLNPASQALGDARVRRALTLAIDRATILREVWDGFGRAASGPVPLPATADIVLPAYDPRGAAALLTAAGLQPDDQGVRLRLRHLVQATEPWPRLGTALRRALGQVGVELSLKTVSPAAWSDRAPADYDTTGRMAEFGGNALLDAAARARLVADAMQVWLVEPAMPVAPTASCGCQAASTPASPMRP